MAYSEKGLKVYQMIKDHLNGGKFHFEAHDDDLVITLTVHGEDLPQLTIIRVMDDRDVIQVLSPIPGNIPEEKRAEAAVAVAAANMGMINGSFDFDLKDGEIRFRVAQSYADIEPSEELLKYILGIAFYTTDKFNDKFFMYQKGMLSLEEFIKKADE